MRKKEIWSSISFAPGYEVSTRGRVRGPRKMLKFNIKHGYAYVTLCSPIGRQTYRVHRLVAMTFIPNPNNLPQVNHIDYNPLNNSVENLEWITQSGNSQWSAEHMSQALKGRAFTDEHRQRISDARQVKRDLPLYIYAVRKGYYKAQIIIQKKILLRKTVPTLEEAIALKERCLKRYDLNR